MNNLVGIASASNQSCFPIAITLDSITVRLESFERNKTFDCGSCFYMRDSDSICPFVKETVLNPSPRKKLRAVAIVAHIVNASDADFCMSVGDWIMIDSQGYKFNGISACDSFYSRRLQSADSVLPSTQTRQLVLFPELEEDIMPAVFILRAERKEFRFEVGELSESVKHLLKPPKPTDDLVAKTKAYVKSDSYRLFINSLNKLHSDIAPEYMDFIVANLASNYYSYVGNSNNVWDNEKELLEHYPYIVSLAEICAFDIAQKTIITIPTRALDACTAILNRYDIDYKTYLIDILGENLTAITFFQVYSSNEAYQSGVSIGNMVWDDIESSRVKCGICTLTKTLDNAKHPDRVYLSGGRELDLSDLRRNANAGYREDLHEAFRSSWEANIARVLRLAKHQYKYESQVYEMKKYNYLPDFTLEDGTILEVKGLWDKESLGKVSEFHKTFPNVRIITLDSELYFDLCKKYKDIPTWEQSSISIHNNILSVVGLSFVSDQTVFDELSVGAKVLFVREPNNQYDNYAILVTSLDGKPIGHVSAEWAVVYAPKLDAGVKYEVTVKEIASKVIKVEAKRTNTEQEILYDCFVVNNVYDDTEEQGTFSFF